LKGQGLWLVLDESMALLYFILNSG